MLKTADIVEMLKVSNKGFKHPFDALFKNDDKYFPKYIKKGVLTVEEEEEFHPKNQIFCNVPSCERFFESVYAYQTHYNSLHRYICSQCKKSLPTPHLLDLHLSENHDSYFSVVSKNKPMFSCFIEECTHKCITAEERKDHCIKAHKFPMNFRFENLCMVGKKVPDVRNEMVVDVPMESEKNNSKKQNTNISFGHTKSKTFNKNSYAKLLSKSNVQYKNTLEDSNTVNDLLKSLPE